MQSSGPFNKTRHDINKFAMKIQVFFKTLRHATDTQLTRREALLPNSSQMPNIAKASKSP
jgi:hypothetical protein